MYIRIIPIGNIPRKILEALSTELSEILNSRVKILDSVKVPHDAYNHWRKQYDAKKIIQNLSELSQTKFIDKSMPLLYVIDEDIYFSGLNFIFGLEDPIQGACIISITRLRNEFYDLKPNLSILIERSVKEAIHELGHFMGLEHCSHPFCVMCFSPSVGDIDRKQKDFCRDCKYKLSLKGYKIE
ncbi:MAG: archaemetzincin family Zn-dependent metalloprotease [Candidatus Aenigmatarchaeota archaeon]|nr:archaemetzincin family Zn-dependent metalloprotease [Candidatus Aenigmarchaeota archaeon]